MEPVHVADGNPRFIMADCCISRSDS
jgi:hypothetical protein